MDDGPEPEEIPSLHAGPTSLSLSYSFTITVSVSLTLSSAVNQEIEQENDEPTWRCSQNPSIGARGTQEPALNIRDL